MKGMYKTLFGIGLLLTACASTPVWVVQPTVQHVASADYEIELAAVKENTPFFSAFDLKIVNHSAETIFIDWNQSRYLFNNRPDGVLVFAQIDPETVKEGKIPKDAIASGATFSRRITPFERVAFTPYRDTRAPEKQTGIKGGLMPSGQNGVALSLQIKGEVRMEKLNVTIDSQQP